MDFEWAVGQEGGEKKQDIIHSLAEREAEVKESVQVSREQVKCKS